MKLSAGILLAPGFEEIEAITPIDILRRASFEVTSVGISSGPITASRSTRHLADISLDQVGERVWDVLILPGGLEGVSHLKQNTEVRNLILKHVEQGKWIAAICAAPTILNEMGLLSGKSYVSHPGVQSKLPQDGLCTQDRVVVCDRLITSLAAGSAMEFSYEIVRQLLGEDAVRQVNQGVCASLS